MSQNLPYVTIHTTIIIHLLTCLNNTILATVYKSENNNCYYCSMKYHNYVNRELIQISLVKP